MKFGKYYQLKCVWGRFVMAVVSLLTITFLSENLHGEIEYYEREELFKFKGEVNW